MKVWGLYNLYYKINNPRKFMWVPWNGNWNYGSFFFFVTCCLNKLRKTLLCKEKSSLIKLQRNSRYEETEKRQVSDIAQETLEDPVILSNFLREDKGRRCNKKRSKYRGTFYSRHLKNARYKGKFVTTVEKRDILLIRAKQKPTKNNLDRKFRSNVFD